MYSGGDAAEQVVRLSLEGFDVAARLTGSAAKNVAILLAAALKEEHKTRGKTRLTNMIRSGKELKVFSVLNKDLEKFVEQAKRYGVLYCVLAEKNQKDGNVPVDIIARAEDASKIQRIFERFGLGVVDRASVTTETGNGKTEHAQRTGGSEVPENGKSEPKNNLSEQELTGEQLFDELMTPNREKQGEPEADQAEQSEMEQPGAEQSEMERPGAEQSEVKQPEMSQPEPTVEMEGETVEGNPTRAVTEKDPLSAQNSGQTDLPAEPEPEAQQKKPSVKEKLERFSQEAKKQQRETREKVKQKDRTGSAAKQDSRKKSGQKKHKSKNRKKER